MYDLTLNIETEQSGLNYIEPGIQENLRLGKLDNSYPIVYEKTDKSEFIAFHFLNEDNKPFVHTEWVPRATEDAVLQKKQANLVKRLMHIGKKFVDESALKKIGKPETFEALAKGLIAVIDDNYKNKFFRCKIVYNNKNYTTFPNYVPFIESMNVPIEKSNLKLSLDDKIIKSRADVVITKTNPFAVDEDEPETTDTPQPQSEDDLPF